MRKLQNWIRIGVFIRNPCLKATFLGLQIASIAMTRQDDLIWRYAIGCLTWIHDLD